MEFKNKHTETFIRPFFGTSVVSINDLRDREFSGSELSQNEKQALVNFDRYRLKELNSQKTERDFHNKYIQLQVMANLSPFEEFLKEIYSCK